MSEPREKLMEQPNEGVNGVAKPEGQSPSGEEQGPHDDYHDYSRTVGGMEVASKFLQTTIEKGLTNHEVEERRKEFGPNQISEQRNWTLHFLRCFFGYTPFMLSATALVAVVLHDWIDMAVLLGLQSYIVWSHIRSTIGVDDIIRTLALSVDVKAIVVREGLVVEIPASEVVPGDIVHASNGSIMPADCRITSKDGALQLDQSAITGESEPVTKVCGDICYASTNIIHGDAFLIAIATGKKTFLGRAASIVRPSPEDPECNSRIKRLDLRRILAALAAAVTLAFVVSMTQSRHGLFKIKTLELAFALAVAGLPMPLPAIIGAIRTQSLTRYTRMGLLFKDSCRPCLEFLASVDIFCVDKTGTLTQNRLQAYEPFCMDGFDPEELMLTACLTADRKKRDVDAIDRSLLRALKHHPRAGADLGRFQVLDYQPFSTLTKMTSSLVESPSGERIFCVKGAPKFVLDRARRDDPNVGETKDRYVDAVNDATRRGFRTLGVARQREGGRWELLGLIPLLDAPRFDTASALKEAKRMDVGVKMLTGDAEGVAIQTCRMIGLGQNVQDAESLLEGDVCDAKSRRVEAADGFTVVFPQHKEKLVRILQQRGHIVAITGDGVNDSPTLKLADAGVAVEGSAERAQAAADIVQYKTAGLMPVIKVIRASRQLFQRVHAYVVFRIALSVQLVLFLAWYAGFGGRMLSLLLLLLNVHFADIVGVVIAYEDHETPYSRQPVQWSLMDILKRSGTLGSLLALNSCLLTWTRLPFPDYENLGGSSNQAVFLQLVLSQHWLIFLTRTNGSFWRYPSPTRLVRTVVLIDVAASLFCWLFAGLSVSLIASTWAFSIGSFCTTAGSYCLLQKEQGFDDLVAEKQRGQAGCKQSVPA